MHDPDAHDDDRSSYYEFDPFAEADDPSREDDIDPYEGLDSEDLNAEPLRDSYEITKDVPPTPKLLADHYPGGFPISRPDRLHLLVPWVLRAGNMEWVESCVAAAHKAMMVALQTIPSEGLSRISQQKLDWVRAKVIDAERAVREHQLWLDAKYACAVSCTRPVPAHLSREAWAARTVMTKYNRPMGWFVEARERLFAHPDYRRCLKVRNALAKRKPATRAQGRRYDASDTAKAARAARKKPSTPESRAAEAARKRTARAARKKEQAEFADVLDYLDPEAPTEEASSDAAVANVNPNRVGRT